MIRKFALVIGNSRYQDPVLAELKTPDADVHALAATLRDPAIGGFDEVQELLNENESTVRRAISSFYDGKKPDDLLLMYFSGHGVLDSQGRLFLAVQDTQRQLLRATAIPANFITEDMDSSRSKRQVLILDCCHSGAFARGTKGDATAIDRSTFAGNGLGRVVLTASDSTQYALEGDRVDEAVSLSLFTHYLIEGLKTGEADLGADNWIAVDEWYDYAYERVLGQTPNQTPKKWEYNTQGDLIIARNPKPKQVKPVQLPTYLLTALHSELPRVRLEAVDQLEELLLGPSPELSVAAEAELERMAKQDDSHMVSSRAADLLTQSPRRTSTQSVPDPKEPATLPEEVSLVVNSGPSKPEVVGPAANQGPSAPAVAKSPVEAQPPEPVKSEAPPARVLDRAAPEPGIPLAVDQTAARAEQTNLTKPQQPIIPSAPAKVGERIFLPTLCVAVCFAIGAMMLAGQGYSSTYTLIFTAVFMAGGVTLSLFLRKLPVSREFYWFQFSLWWFGQFLALLIIFSYHLGYTGLFLDLLIELAVFSGSGWLLQTRIRGMNWGKILLGWVGGIIAASFVTWALVAVTGGGEEGLLLAALGLAAGGVGGGWMHRQISKASNLA